MRYFSTLLVLLIVNSCGTNTKPDNLKEVPLELLESFNSIEDSIFFASTSDIEVFDNRYYLSDYKQNIVYSFSNEWNNVIVIGSEGQGPGDFRGPTNIEITNDYISIMDEYSRTLKLFSKDHSFIKSVKLPYSVSPDTEFTSNNNTFFQYSKRYELITHFDTNGQILSSYGNFEKDTKGRYNSQTNSWHTTIEAGKLFVINKCEPLILTYDLQTKELNGSYDLGKMTILKDKLSYVTNEIEKDPYARKSYILFSDVLIEGNFIYLLFTNYDQVSSLAFSNQILKVSLTEANSFQINGIYGLDKNGWYESFTIDNDKLITFNEFSSSVEIYKLK